MSRPPFLEALKNRVLIFDGAMGTELYAKGFYINRPFEELNTTCPQDVKSVHTSYLENGADVLSTNTFSIPKTQLKKFDIEHKQNDFIEAALKNVAESISEFHLKAKSQIKPIYTGFSVGPLGVLVEPLGPVSKDDVFKEYAGIAKAIKSSKNLPDFLSLETFGNLTELEAAVRGLRSEIQDLPLLVNLTTKVGQKNLVQNFGQIFGSNPLVEVLGLNCCEGPSQVFTDLQTLSTLTEKPIVVQPNAGIPRQINGRYFYMTSPDYLAKYARRYVEAGANAVGGCCGTTPEHIAAIAQALKVSNAQKRVGQISLGQAETQPKKELTPIDWAQRARSKLGTYLKENKKILSIEVTPPKGTSVEKFFNDLTLLKNSGVDFVNIPDGPRASTRISSLHLSVAVAQRFKGALTPVPHFTTRDRNLIALQADLLGAYVNGVSEILFVTGDPPKVGNNKDATGVYDIDSIGLTYLAHCLNHGITPAGEDLGSSTGFGIGVASNPTAINVAEELSRWNFKCQMGADFAFTQPIYDPEIYLRWIDKIGANFRPHIVGIWPFVSLRNAEFMANEVPGVSVPKWAIEEMAKAGDNKIEAQKRGVEIATRVIQKIGNNSAGFSISAPLGRTEVALETIQVFK
jgi:methionine synthase I (cobalamin-dependent)/5,10-methylenetetrahydrofolate reductase